MKKKYTNNDKKCKRCNLVFTTVKGLKRSKQKVTSFEENNMNIIHQEERNIFKAKNSNQEGGFNE